MTFKSSNVQYFLLWEWFGSKGGEQNVLKIHLWYYPLTLHADTERLVLYWGLMDSILLQAQ